MIFQRLMKMKMSLLHTYTLPIPIYSTDSFYNNRTSTASTFIASISTVSTNVVPTRINFGMIHKDTFFLYIRKLNIEYKYECINNNTLHEFQNMYLSLVLKMVYGTEQYESVKFSKVISNM